MSKPKFYAYGIIQSNQGKNFGPIGVGEQNNEVVTVPYEDLALVISKFIGGFCAPTRQNLLQHEKVIVKVMEECTIIPMRFGHAFKSKGQIKNFLQKNYLQLKALLKKFIKKVELALKIHWKKEAFGEDIFEEHPELSSFQKKIAALPPEEAYSANIRLGEMVAKIADQKRAYYEKEILDRLEELAADAQLKEIQDELMVLNSVFLVEKEREKEFDQQINELYEKFQSKLNFNYSGPWAPYNFVNLNLTM